MLLAETIDHAAECQVEPRGARLLSRTVVSPWVSYLESGRVALGVMEAAVMEHQLGAVEGPCWLEASSAVLDLPHAVDAVAESEVVLRRVPLAELRRALAQTGDRGVMAVTLQQRKRSIAAQLGIAPETLSRVLRHLRERSLISGSGRLLNVVDPGGLRLLAGG